jgi:DNA repair protein SbcD/Mre11
MKLLHTADIHLGMENYGRFDSETGLHSRMLDFLRALDVIVDRAVSEKVEVFLFSGDAFKTRDPTQTQQREFAKRIKKVTDAGIPVVMLVGNHDTPNSHGKANALDIYSVLKLEGVHVIRELEKINVGVLQIVGLPWLSKQDFEGIAGKIKYLIEGLDQSKPAVAMIHGSVEGATYGGWKEVTLGHDMSVAKEWFDNSKLQYVALGHIHKMQVIPGTKIPMVYSGSIERIDFGESGEDKGFRLINIDKTGGKWKTSHEHVSTNPRPLITVKAIIKEGMNPTEEILRAIGKVNIRGAVVKVVVNIEVGADAAFDISKIRVALNEAWHVVGISKNIERSTRDNLGSDAVSELSPKQALEKYFVAKSFSPIRSDHLMKLAERLLADF